LKTTHAVGSSSTLLKQGRRLASQSLANSVIVLARAVEPLLSENCAERRQAANKITKAKRMRWISKPVSVSTSAEFPVVAIGASAGGLEAYRKLLEALPPTNGMAFIIVQHLDPSHDSMLVDLLAGHTSMPVLLADDGMQIEPERVYVIPPGVYLSADRNGALKLSKPQARHGARLPFDFLLNSLASEYGARTVCVVLSGTGADGSVGLKAVKDKGGLVIAQDIGEADYDGMPRSAVATGAVDMVLRVARIAEALLARERGRDIVPGPRKARAQQSLEDLLPDIIDLLRTKTVHDFSLYKRGTLQRRVERRITLAGVKTAGKYLDVLLRDADERDHLSRDLLINVTGFFRNPEVFDFLAKGVIPDLLRDHPADRPLRIWVAGCSSGEETYSLAMLFREQIDASKREIKLQIFASDVDPDAVTSARDGLYPNTIEADVSRERLVRFFSKEDQYYRISTELRSCIVFTVHDVLVDPPFARLDFVSCRNLLIYLLPEAQTKVISLIHFALREGGLLLVGDAETVDVAVGLFTTVSKTERLYRRVAGGRRGEHPPSISPGGQPRARREVSPMRIRQEAFTELCRRGMLEAYGAAAVLTNAKLECLHFEGPTDRYLKIAPGRPGQDLIAKARDGVRAKLRSTVHRALRENARVTAPGGHLSGRPVDSSFHIDVQPVASEREQLLLVCFVEDQAPKAAFRGHVTKADVPRVIELERELETTRIELEHTIRDLETSHQEQMAINEEALSVNEEYQSTNEELLASKEELQSLNEELNALNSQLQETLERQRTTADDLQNVLYSTKVPTIFLDTRFNIRFFTPITKALFSVIPSDVGRPLTDLKSLAYDDGLLDDARLVLKTQTPLELEIQGQGGAWFVRRIMPYRASDEETEGVVITYEDVTERRHTADVLVTAKRQAESANLAKTRFLAAASHDLRQPLQTLALLQALLAKTVVGEKAQQLIERVDDALGAMTGMLNTLLDINQIEVGSVKPEIADFAVNDLFDHLREELTYHAQAAGLAFRVAPCAISIRSDQRLLEQMIRNLISNALKYTKSGKVLLGCRRRGGKLRIQIWDTGIGIPESELQAIFDEYHQVDNAARQRSRGLGLGLSIVKSLGELLGHPVGVRSLHGKGSVFSIEVALTPGGHTKPDLPPRATNHPSTHTPPLVGAILIIEDDPDVREHLELFLTAEGFQTLTAVDGRTALDLLARGTIQPDVVLADYNLPNDMNGVQVAQRLRRELNRQIPFVILTGDISTETRRNIVRHDCVYLHKPVKLNELTLAIEKFLVRPSAALASPPGQSAKETSAWDGASIVVVDDDDLVREAIRTVLEDNGCIVETYSSCEAFLEAFHPGKFGCLLVDAYLPCMDGLELLEKIHKDGHRLPAIMITGNADVQMAVQAMKAGAVDFIEKPIGGEELITSIKRVLELSENSGKLAKLRESAAAHLAELTPRQRAVMENVLAGKPSKNIAADLGISQRTVENHRASIMKRTGSKSLPALARLAVLASAGPEET
jgi:two-component system, chemotaxis family, CheB/CheR fusion protein